MFRVYVKGARAARSRTTAFKEEQIRKTVEKLSLGLSLKVVYLWIVCHGRVAVSFRLS
jgi:hypothetical protein